jgi:hypothetical protein
VAILGYTDATFRTRKVGADMKGDCCVVMMFAHAKRVMKALYVEYTDATFTTLKVRG